MEPDRGGILQDDSGALFFQAIEHEFIEIVKFRAVAELAGHQRRILPPFVVLGRPARAAEIHPWILFPIDPDVEMDICNFLQIDVPP